MPPHRTKEKAFFCIGAEKGFERDWIKAPIWQPAVRQSGVFQKW